MAVFKTNDKAALLISRQGVANFLSAYKPDTECSIISMKCAASDVLDVLRAMVFQIGDFLPVI